MPCIPSSRNLDEDEAQDLAAERLKEWPGDEFGPEPQVDLTSSPEV